MAPSFCQRCKATFESRVDLDLHIGGLKACDPHSREPPEGITPARMQQLKSRKTGKRLNQSKEGKWGEIYKVLFPDVVELPDPCKHLQPRSNRSFISDSLFVDFEPIQEEPVHAILNDYEIFSEEAMSNLFRTKLDSESPFTVLSTELKDNLVSLLKFCNTTSLASYRSALTTLVTKPTPPPLPVTTAVDTNARYSCPPRSPVFLSNEAFLFTTSLSQSDFTLDMGRTQEYEGRDQVQAF
jgi:hypothetical protein